MKNNLVLLVDDNPNNIQVLASIIAECGYEIGIAQSANETYQFLKGNAPNLILLDVEMPDIDGYEVCSTLKADPRYNDIPIIFLTVKSEMDDIVKGFDLGAVDYITKPFNRRELISRVKTHMMLKQSMDELAYKNGELEHSRDALAKKNGEFKQSLLVQRTLEEEKDILTTELMKHRDLLEKKVEERTRELETANHKITNIVESISDGFLALDKEWRYIYLNHNPYLHEGRTAQDLIGENIWSIFPEIVGTFWYQEFHRAMEERITVTFETPSAYQEIWYEVRVYPFEDGICCFFKDITDKKRYEQEFKRLSGLDLIGQMAAGISHEIRNPMTTVRGFLQLLSTKEDCLKYEEFFTLMIDELDRANSIISEFLSMGNTRLSNLQELNLNDVLSDITPLLQGDAFNENKQIEINTSKVPNLQLNRNEIRQLILNLYRNGLEAMESGKTLTIRTYMENDDVVLAIEDQGSGIKPDVLEKLGTPFFSTKDNGTGLGLGVCYGIAARHNAKIDIETSSSGTTFFVRFTNKPGDSSNE